MTDKSSVALRDELSVDELSAVSGGTKKPAPGSTGSPTLDKALADAKVSIAAWVASQKPIVIP